MKSDEEIVLSCFLSEKSQRTFDRLFEESKLNSAELKAAINSLLEKKKIRSVYRVFSRFTGEGLQDFEDLSSIPKEIEDDSVECDPITFEVGLVDILTIYMRNQ